MENCGQEERVLPGILGAFLFSLSGGVVWFLLWQVDMIAGLSGLVGVFCAIKGYGIFGKKESIKGVIIASVFALLSLALAWYLCIGFDYYQAFQAEGMDMPLMDCLFNGFELIETYGAEDTLSLFVKDLAIGIGFSLLVCVSYIVQAVKKAKNS